MLSNDFSRSRKTISFAAGIVLIVVAFVALVVAAIATFALVQARIELQQTYANRASSERWRVQGPVSDPNGSMDQLRAENISLRNEIAQARAQLRAFENSRSTVRSVNPGMGRNSSSSVRLTGPEL